MQEGKAGSCLHSAVDRAGEGEVPWETESFQAGPCALGADGIASCQRPAHLCEIHTSDGTHGGGDLSQETVHIGHGAAFLSAENNDLIHFGEGSRHFGSNLGKQG